MAALAENLALLDHCDKVFYNIQAYVIIDYNV